VIPRRNQEEFVSSQSHSPLVNRIPAASRDDGAVRALTEVAAAEGRDLKESGLLCAGLLLAAVVSLVWSLPTPGVEAAFALLCFALIGREHARARAQFRRGIARAGAAKGLSEQEAGKTADALLKAWDASRPEG
jgi:hypothetical protein